MSSRQAILQAKILLLLGWVDGELDGPEGKASRQLVDETGEREALKVELRKMGAELPDKEVVLADVAAAPAEIARAAIRSGFALSKADGIFTRESLRYCLSFLGRPDFQKASFVGSPSSTT